MQGSVPNASKAVVYRVTGARGVLGARSNAVPDVFRGVRSSVRRVLQGHAGLHVPKNVGIQDVQSAIRVAAAAQIVSADICNHCVGFDCDSNTGMCNRGCPTNMVCQEYVYSRTLSFSFPKPSNNSGDTCECSPGYVKSLTGCVRVNLGLTCDQCQKRRISL